MAKYAQGYERKSSDTKNLIVLFASIIGAVALFIGIIAIINVFRKDNERSFSTYKYSSYILTTEEYSNLVKQDDKSYMIYFFTSSDGAAADTNEDAVLDYLDKYIESGTENGLMRLYLVDYASFDSTSEDDNETQYADAIKNALNGFSPQVGYLLYIENNVFNPAKVVTATKVSSSTPVTVKSKLESLQKGNKW